MRGCEGACSPGEREGSGRVERGENRYECDSETRRGRWKKNSGMLMAGLEKEAEGKEKAELGEMKEWETEKRGTKKERRGGE